MKETIFFRVAFVVTACVILWLAITSAGLPFVSYSDKLNHGFAFAVLYFLADFGWSNGRHMRHKAGGLLLFGVLIEVLQSFTQNRLAEWGDIGADVVGLAIYYTLHQPAAKVAFWRRWLTPPH
ncbi:MAG: VanZ family protein [Gammaproteobacteria bacterium]|nr:MAG: VanZ family protein [Gammaproteobacteria bacterium]